MKKIILLCMAFAACTTLFAYDKATKDATYFGSQCKAVGMDDGTVAVVEYYIPDADAAKTDLVFPASIEIWEGEPAAKTAEYEVSVIGGGWAMWVKLGDDNKLNTMTSITIPEGVKVIAKDAFKEAAALQTLNLPSSLTEIGGWAFYSCINLTAIYSKPAAAPVVGEKAFRPADDDTAHAWDYIFNNCKVYVPSDAAKATYNQDSDPWTDWRCFFEKGNIIVDPSTAIDQITNHQSPITNKAIRNGQILIRRGNTLYNLQGAVVE